MRRPRHLNPAETASFMVKHSRLPDEHKADSALTWRERAVEQARLNRNPAGDMAEVAIGAGYAAAIGAHDGVQEYKRYEMVRAWDAPGGIAEQNGIDPAVHKTPFATIRDERGQVVWQAQRDPRTGGLGVVKGFWPTLGFAILAGTGVGGYRFNRYFRAPAVAGGGYIAGTATRDAMFQRRLNQLSAAGPTVTAQNGNGNGNGANGNGGNGQQTEGNPGDVFNMQGYRVR